MARTLLVERHRWRYLCFWNTDWNGSVEDPSEILFEMPKSPMSLEEFELRYECHENVFPWLAVTKPQILRFYNRPIAPLTKMTWWDELSSLEIRGDEEEPDLNVSIYNILSSLRYQLSDLNLHRVPLNKFDLENMEFPRLQQLELEDVDYWWMFPAPNIVSLRLSPSNKAPPDTVIAYIHLTHLEYNAYFIPLRSEILNLPKLVSIQLENPKVGVPGINLVWCKTDGTLSSGPAKEITIRGIYHDTGCVRYEDLISSLQPHMDLVKLQLECLNFPVAFYEAFIKTASQRAILCPHLRELVVNLFSISTELDVGQYHETFQTLAQERRHGDSPLERLHVTWPSYTSRVPRDYTLQ
jgi:hypothetical protein